MSRKGSACCIHPRSVQPSDVARIPVVYHHRTTRQWRWSTATMGRYFHPVCESTLNYWLDNADDDPDLEPADIVWL